MNDGSIGYGGVMAPRVGVMAAPAVKRPAPRKRPAYHRLTDQIGRVPTTVQSDANRMPRGGAVDLNIETDLR
jgi:hypothetical protein